MTTKVILSDTWTAIDTSAADVLVTPHGTHAYLIELFMKGPTAPAAADEGHHLKQPFVLPKGVGAYVRGAGAIYVSPMLAK
ncbi:hypothetical protein SB5439_04974 [Klebsiella variicola]|uniref:hypothetical protein n=1 Tax=Klebsiella variicola TaxID=244366 RepID=UPI00109C55B2|nr:hypothetical protein [Klebsiella variicola]VGQ11622.1 hypothetical protein SB5439_04974 [Klebsiella variicola]